MSNNVTQIKQVINTRYSIWFILSFLMIATICAFMATFLKASPWLFILIVLCVYFSRPPRYFLSPRNIITAFYFLWYGVGVLIGVDRYGHMSFENVHEVNAYIMVTFGFFFWYVGAVLGEEQAFRPSKFKLQNFNIPPKLLFWFLWGGAILFASLYIQASGGLSLWLTNPGKAFLNREGSGVFVIVFYTFIHTAAILASYLAAHKKNYFYFIFTLLTTIVLIPLLGGKGRIVFQIFLICGCFIYNKKTDVKLVVGFSSVLVFIFVTISAFRSGNSDASLLANMARNYFDTYQALVMLLRDFQPGEKLTILMPFNKFDSLIGQEEGVFYDMSLWLTSVYFPTIAKFRATVQWPIEADIYLSFGFFPGLPLILGWGYIAGRIFSLSLHTKQCGLIYLALNLITVISSHARGGVIYWTDLWLIPTLAFSYMLLRDYKLYDEIDGNKGGISCSN